VAVDLRRGALDAHHVARRHPPLLSPQTRFFHPASTLASVRRRVFSSAPLRHPPRAQRSGRAKATMTLPAHFHPYGSARVAQRGNLSGHDRPETAPC
jgi:hypothetical protein